MNIGRYFFYLGMDWEDESIYTPKDSIQKEITPSADLK